MLFEIGIGDVERAFDNFAGPGRKPSIQRTGEGCRCRDREQDRRQSRDDAEQQNDPHMQPGAGDTRSPCARQPNRLPCDHGDHRHDQQNIRKQHHDHDLVARHDRGQAGQNEIGGQTGDDRQNDDHQSNPESQAVGLGERQPVLVEGAIRVRSGISSHHKCSLSSNCRERLVCSAGRPVTSTHRVVLGSHDRMHGGAQ